MLCYAMLCYAMLCYAMLCYAMLCYAMLCYAMLCHAVIKPGRDSCKGEMSIMSIVHENEGTYRGGEGTTPVTTACSEDC